MKLINLPNIITCCNLICGCMAIYLGLNDQVEWACLCIILGAVFDFFDGMTARALHISGPIGKELDSLADMVSFGVAPSVLFYEICVYIDTLDAEYAWLAFLMASIMAAFSALRLAKFNCDERQHLSFIGLPTPSNALFWIGMSFMVRIPAVYDFISLHAWGCGVCFGLLLVVMSVLLICELPMFSLKIKPGHNGFAENKARYIFLSLTVLILLVALLLGTRYLFASPAFIILLYIIISAIDARS